MRDVRTTSASEVQLIRDRQAEWTLRLGLVANSERFVLASSYYLGPDETGAAFLEAMTDAARRGVAATLVLDTVGQRLGASAWTPGQQLRIRRELQDAQDAGLRVVWTGPGSRLRELVGGGHHVKILVADRGPALFSSSNLSHHSFDLWGELAVAVRGPVRRVLLQALQAVIPEADPTLADHLEPQPATDDPIGLQWWWCHPPEDPRLGAPLLREAGPNPITDGLVRALANARESAVLSGFYIKPMPALRGALIDAARRGVSVALVHSDAQALGGADGPWLAAATDYPALLDAGIAIHEVAGGEHSKTALIDRSWGAIGTYNHDHAAHDVVTEAMLCSADPRFVDPLAQVLDTIREAPGTTRVPTDFRQDWTLGRRVRARLVKPLRRWL